MKESHICRLELCFLSFFYGLFPPIWDRTWGTLSAVNTRPESGPKINARHIVYCVKSYRGNEGKIKKFQFARQCQFIGWKYKKKTTRARTSSLRTTAPPSLMTLTSVTPGVLEFSYAPQRNMTRENPIKSTLLIATIRPLDDPGWVDSVLGGNWGHNGLWFFFFFFGKISSVDLPHTNTHTEQRLRGVLQRTIKYSTEWLWVWGEACGHAKHPDRS